MCGVFLCCLVFLKSAHFPQTDVEICLSSGCLFATTAMRCENRCVLLKYSLSRCCSSLPHVGRFSCRGRWTLCGNGEGIWCHLALSHGNTRQEHCSCSSGCSLSVSSSPGLHCREGEELCACPYAPACWEGNLRGVLGPCCLC